MYSLGQEIIAIATHPQGFYSKGDERMVMGIRKGFCSCTPYMIDTGDKPSANWNTLACAPCNKKIRLTDRIMWHDPNDFVPVITNRKEETIKETTTL